jgi:hypothetical protein
MSSEKFQYQFDDDLAVPVSPRTETTAVEDVEGANTPQRRCRCQTWYAVHVLTRYSKLADEVVVPQDHRHCDFGR